jgi:hypothetical protein
MGNSKTRIVKIQPRNIQFLSESRLNASIVKLDLLIDQFDPFRKQESQSREENIFKMVNLRSKKVLKTSMFTQGWATRFDILDPTIIHQDVFKQKQVISWSLTQRGNTLPCLGEEAYWRTEHGTHLRLEPVLTDSVLSSKPSKDVLRFKHGLLTIQRIRDEKNELGIEEFDQVAETGLEILKSEFKDGSVELVWLGRDRVIETNDGSEG